MQPSRSRIALSLFAVLLASLALAMPQEPSRPRGFLGISLEPVSTAMRIALGLEEGRGVLVRRVVPGSAAEEAGLLQGDVILEIAGRPVRGPRELARRVGDLGPGRSLDLKVWRGGQQLHHRAFLQERPDAAGRSRMPESRARHDRVGLSFAPLTEQLSTYFGAPGGTLITRVVPGSAGEIAGLLAGDVIVAAGEVEIRGAQHLLEILSSWEEPAVVLAVVRNGNDIYLRVPLQ